MLDLYQVLGFLLYIKIGNGYKPLPDVHGNNFCCALYDCQTKAITYVEMFVGLCRPQQYGQLDCQFDLIDIHQRGTKPGIVRNKLIPFFL